MSFGAVACGQVPAALGRRAAELHQSLQALPRRESISACAPVHARVREALARSLITWMAEFLEIPPEALLQSGAPGLGGFVPGASPRDAVYAVPRSLDEASLSNLEATCCGLSISCLSIFAREDGDCSASVLRGGLARGPFQLGAWSHLSEVSAATASRPKPKKPRPNSRPLTRQVLSCVVSLEPDGRARRSQRSWNQALGALGLGVCRAADPSVGSCLRRAHGCLLPDPRAGALEPGPAKTQGSFFESEARGLSSRAEDSDKRVERGGVAAALS